VEVQRDIKQNAEEVQDYLRDLNSWTEDIKKKDEQLIKNKTENPPNQNLPPVRSGKIETKSIKSNKKSSKTSNGSSSILRNALSNEGPPSKKEKSGSKDKIKSYEYDKWAKFDVDAACADVDGDHEDDAETSEDESEEEEAMEDERLRQQAVEEKERGNQFFKAGKYDQAIEKYTAGIQCDPMNAMIPANRAMALLKKEQYGAAERDTSMAISIDKTYIKAYQRRASARIGLGKLEEAIEDFNKVLELEPPNKAAKAEKEKLLEMIEDKNKPKVAQPKSDMKDNMKGIFDKGNQKSKSVKLEVGSKSSTRLIIKDEDSSDPSLVFPIFKPPHQRSKKPLRRIEISEVGFEEEQKFEAKSEKVDPGKMEAKPKITEVGPTVPLEKSICDENDASKDEVKPVTKSKGFTRKVEEEIVAELKELPAKVTGGAAGGELGDIPKIPKGYSQFVVDWRSCSHVDQRMRYLDQFKIRDYKLVFKNSLDSKHFSEILSTLEQGQKSGFIEKDKTGDHLEGLSQLPRISPIAMFMDKKEQNIMKSLIAFAWDVVTDEQTDRWNKVFHL